MGVAQADIHREGVGTLDVHDEVVVKGIVVGRLYRALAVGDLLLVLGDVLGLADEAGDLRHLLQALHHEVGVHHGGGEDDLLVVGGDILVGVEDVGAAPVAQAPASLLVADHQTVGGMRLQVVDVAAHLGVVVRQHRRIAVVLVELVGNLYDGRSPAAGSAAAVDVGCGVLDVTREGVLAVSDVLHPLLVEGLGVQGSQHRVTGELTVARVASPLQVGAIRGMTRVHVAEHGVQEGLVCPVEGLVVAVKGGGGGYVGVDHLDPQGLCPADDLKATEAVPGKVGLDHPSRAVGDGDKALAVVVGHVEPPIGQGLLGEQDRHRLPGGGGELQDGVARGVLPAVVDLATVLSLTQTGNGQRFDEGVSGAARGAVFSIQIFGQGGVIPPAVVEVSPEAVCIGGVVVMLGLGEGVARYEAPADAAGLVRDEIRRVRAALHRHAVDGLGEAEGTASVGVPAAAVVDGDGVLPLASVRGDIEPGDVDAVGGQHLPRGISPRLKIRGQGEEGVGIDANAVDIALEEAQAQDVQGDP